MDLYFMNTFFKTALYFHKNNKLCTLCFVHEPLSVQEFSSVEMTVETSFHISNIQYNSYYNWPSYVTKERIVFYENFPKP